MHKRSIPVTVMIISLLLLNCYAFAQNDVVNEDERGTVDGLKVKVLGKQLRNGTVSLLIKNMQSISVYSFVLWPDNAFIEKTRIPYGWSELPGDLATFFITNDNPISSGKLKIFRLKVNSDSPLASFNWAANDKEGSMLDSGVLEIKSTYSSLQSKSSTQCKGGAVCFTGLVTHIVDGDTIDVNTVRVRLALVNTPERGDHGYAEATTFTTTLCPVGSTALVDEDDGQTQGSYDRMIGKVFCGNKVLNEELLKAGLAVMYTNFCAVSEFSSEDWAQRYGC